MRGGIGVGGMRGVMGRIRFEGCRKILMQLLGGKWVLTGLSLSEVQTPFLGLLGRLGIWEFGVWNAFNGGVGFWSKMLCTLQNLLV